MTADSKADDRAADVVVRPAESDDVVRLVSAHKQLELGLMSRLSPKIISLYYENALELPNFICRTLWRDKAFAGFYQINVDLGISRTAPFFQRATDLVRALIISPASLFLILRYVLTRVFGSAHSAPAVAPRDCELLYIGVLKEFQGLGYGSLLIADIKKRLREHGIDHLVFEVFRADTGAIEFYRRYSAETLGEVYSPGAPGYLMRIPRDRMPD